MGLSKNHVAFLNYIFLVVVQVDDKYYALLQWSVIQKVPINIGKLTNILLNYICS